MYHTFSKRFWFSQIFSVSLFLGGCAHSVQTPLAIEGPDSKGFQLQSVAQTAGIPATLTIDETQIIRTGTDKLLGMSFDGRSSLSQKKNGTSVLLGYYNQTTGALRPEVGLSWSSQKPTTFRFPGNAYSTYDFRRTIGPLAQRQVLNFSGVSGTLAFGFDEFVAMAEAKGINPGELQIMVTIYPGPTFADPTSLAAEWVEYCNAPNDGSNPGGGTDWAAVRAANGHAAPYGIRYWNIGNEPWAATEFNHDPVPYIAAATPVIDAMLAVDPNLRITLPAAAATTTQAAMAAKKAAWDQALITAFANKAYALSPHAFYDEAYYQGTQPKSVYASEKVLDGMIKQTQGSPMKLLMGDHAHAITQMSGVPSIHPDEAMGLRGSLATMDFLLMLTGKAEIERANFWIWGLPAATWHPIRRNTDGSTTLLAVGQLYQILGDVLHPEALQSNLVTAAKSSDSIPYLARARAFRSADGSKLSVIAVNRDGMVDLDLSLAGLSGWQLQKARLLQAPSLQTLTLDIQTLPIVSTSIPLPHQSIVILEYTRG